MVIKRGLKFTRDYFFFILTLDREIPSISSTVTPQPPAFKQNSTGDNLCVSQNHGRAEVCHQVPWQ